MRNVYTAFLMGWFILPCFLFLSVTADAQLVPHFNTVTSSDSHGYYVYLPAGYTTSTKKYPLMMFMHGGGELGKGDSTDLPMMLHNAPLKLIADSTWPDSFKVNGRSFQFIIFAPEFINPWPNNNIVDSEVQYAVSHFRVDTGRIYMTGLSMGGNITWTYVTMPKAANSLAAIVPIAGGDFYNGMTGATVVANANLPVLASANDSDPVTPSSQTVVAVQQINSVKPACNPRAWDTIYNAVGHDAWTTTYDPNIPLYKGLNVYQWMLQYSRNPQDSTTVPPPDTTMPAPPDTTKPAPPDTTKPPVTQPPPPVTPPDTTTPPATPPPPPPAVTPPPPATPPPPPPVTPPDTTKPPATPPPPPPAVTPPPPSTPPQPVQLSSFNAVLLSGEPKVGLSWTTTFEADNRFFIVQRSRDGKTFVNIDTVAAAPDAAKGHSYSTIDQTPFAGDNYYRLAQVGTDADSSYPEIREVIVPQAYANYFNMSPNPTSGALHLYLIDPSRGNVQVRLLDVQGKTLAVWMYQKQAELWIQTVEIGNLGAGSYFMQVIDKDSQVTREFIRR